MMFDWQEDSLDLMAIAEGCDWEWQDTMWVCVQVYMLMMILFTSIHARARGGGRSDPGPCSFALIGRGVRSTKYIKM